MSNLRFVLFRSLFLCLLSAGLLSGQELPVDSNVKIGTLNNGIKYYIRHNVKPEKRAELRLIVNAGSVLENDDQKGLAHFVEHMGFNGSKHFSRNDLVNYLESIGVKFGPELNAYTSFDQTVYMLQVPTDKEEIMKKAFLVLEDWAHGLSMENSEIDKERGVITEEWRLGRGADMRMLDKQLPILFKNSRYADRMTIGDINVIKNFKYETLKDFYRQWYRPDLMAVAAVGDFDQDKIEALIKEHFSSIAMPENPKKRELFPVPGHKETLFAIASDKEATSSSVSIYIKRDKSFTKTEADYRKELTEDLMYTMLNQRLQELTLLPEPPFIMGYAGSSGFTRTTDITYLSAMVKENALAPGLESILREAERGRQFGFTATELERSKANMLRGMEKAVAEKDKTESGRLINEYVGNYLDQEPIPGIENEYALYKKYLPLITLEEVNKITEELLKTSNRVVMVEMPEKEGVKILTEAELTAVMNKVSGEKLTAYEDKVSTKPLIKALPAPGKIVSSSANKTFGFTEWKLSNGIRVIVKPTDFKNDEITFTAFSFGGLSQYPDKDNMSGAAVSALMGESGLGDFSQTELRKYLTGKIASASLSIDQYGENVGGGCSPKDQETMFQLIYANFTNPRIDSIAYLSWKTKTSNMLMNAGNRPEKIISDTLSVTLSNHHVRYRPWTIPMLDEVNFRRSLEIVKDRFSDAGDFTFLFSGNIDTASFKPLVLQYLASLPSNGRKETWKDIHVNYPTGIIEKTVKKGIEPKSQVTIVFLGPAEFSRVNEYKLESLMDVMNIALREAIREEKGGTYGVGASGNQTRVPAGRYSIAIGFGCNPDRVEELTKATFAVIDSIKQYGPNDETVAKVKEIQRRQREVNLKQNRFWNGILSSYLRFNDNIDEINNYNKWVDGLKKEDIIEAAKKYFDGNYVKAVLLPEDKIQ